MMGGAPSREGRTLLVIVLTTAAIVSVCVFVQVLVPSGDVLTQLDDVLDQLRSCTCAEPEVLALPENHVTHMHVLDLSEGLAVLLDLPQGLVVSSFLSFALMRRQAT